MISTAIAGLALAGMGYVVWRAFNPSRAERPGIRNNWQNQDYMARRKDGTWAEGSTMETTSPAPPYRGGAGQ